jgi:tetratricopeptide (TPR) repeat protein
LSPHYRANLAAQFFRHGEYDKAVREYTQVVDGYPLAKLEQANIMRLEGNLDEAREREQLAIEELENDSTMASLPENSLPWVFEIEGSKVSLPSRAQKVCYARLELSATLYLLGDEAQSAQHSNRAAQACGSQTVDIKAVIGSELDRLADEQDGLSARAGSYRRSLAAWGRPH